MLIRLSILIRAKLLLLNQRAAKALATVSAKLPLFCTIPSNVPNGKHATMRIVRRSSVTPTPTLILVARYTLSSSPPFANPSNPRLSLFIVPNSIRVSTASKPYTLHPTLEKSHFNAIFLAHPQILLYLCTVNLRWGMSVHHRRRVADIIKGVYYALF